MASRGRRKRKRRSPWLAAVILFAVILAVAAGVFLGNRYRVFTGYQVDATIAMSNSEENTAYYPFEKGYLKCAGDGVTYFTQQGVNWSENYVMVQPVIDICGGYIAIADMNQRSIYLYDKSGSINRITLSHSITALQVSAAGVIAAASNDGNVNYIEIRDRQGNEIMTEKSVFSSSGFLMDISLSEDGSKLAAVFTAIPKGVLKSRVVFYDLSGGSDNSNIIAGTFEQYDEILLTSVEFMDHNRVCVVGDQALSIYEFQTVPELIYEEKDFPWEIQSLFFSSRYIGTVVEKTDAEERYAIRVIDLEGKVRLEKGFDYAYNYADFAGDHVILYSYNDCLMYNLAGIEKLSCTFEKHIEALKSTDGFHFVYGTNSDTEFITLK